MRIEQSNQINQTLILGLVLALSFQIAGCDLFTSLTDAEHVTRARDFKDKGELRSSVIELKSALQKNPKNAQARWLLGSINVALGYGSAGEKELRKAIELGVARDAVILALVESMQLQGKNQEILNEIEPTASLSPEATASFVAYRGDAWLSKRDSEKARAEYQRALEIDNQNALATLGLARLSSAENDFPKALGLVLEALANSPNESKLWSFQGDLYQRQDRANDAEASYGKAIQYRQWNVADRAKRAIVRIAIDDHQGAQQDINVLKERAPNFFQTHYTDGLLAFNQKRFSDAQSALEQAFNLNVDYYPTSYFLGAVHLMQNHLTQAQEYLSRFVAKNPHSIKGRQILGLAWYKQGKFDRARRVLLPVIGGNPEDIFTLQLLGNIELSLGNQDQGLEYLQKVVEVDPDSAPNRTRLGAAKILTGEVEYGLQELEHSLDLDPEQNRAQALAALTHIRLRKFDKAMRAIETMQKKEPEGPMPQNLLGVLYLSQNDVGKAKLAFQTGLKHSPGDVSASLNLAKIAIREKNFKDARKLYEKVLDTHPKHFSTQLKLAELDAIERKIKDMRDRLNALIEDRPDALQPRLLLSRHHLRYGQPQRAHELLDPVREQQVGHPGLLALLAESEIGVGQKSKALITAKALVRAAPKSARAQFILANAYMATHELENAHAALDSSLKLAPKFLRARLAMVELLVRERRNTDASSRLSAISKEYPDNPAVLATRGWFALRQDRPKDAAREYQEALKKFPSASMVVKLARSQWQAAEKEKAIRTLEDWIQEHPEEAAVRYVLSGYYLTADKPEQAQSQLEEVINLTPNNVFALNDLAWLLLRKDPVNAVKYAEKAVKIAPKIPQVIDTLAMALIERGRNERALRLIRQAVSLAPKSASILYHLGLAQEKNGQLVEARRTLTNLLENRNEFNEKQEAQALLKKLSG